MFDKELLAKIKRINIFTKRIMQTTLAGDYLSAFKGSGIEFDKLREYIPGDDVRFIDWNSSLKTHSLMTKQFSQERDRTVILAVDISSSLAFSSTDVLKKDKALELVAALAGIAANSKDKIGLLLFSDRVEKWIPPSKNRVHVFRMFEELISIKPQSKQTSIAEAAKFLIRLKQKNCIVFMISDWIDDISTYSRFLKIASLKHELIAIRLLDKIENNFPDIGYVEVEDIETGEISLLNTSTKTKFNGISLLNSFLIQRSLEQKKLFNINKIDFLDLNMSLPILFELIKFFHRRSGRTI